MENKDEFFNKLEEELVAITDVNGPGFKAAVESEQYDVDGKRVLFISSKLLLEGQTELIKVLKTRSLIYPHYIFLFSHHYLK